MQHQHASKRLVVLGTSFRTSEASIREASSLSESEAAALLLEAKSSSADAEGAVLSTCNRSELYLAVSRERDLEVWFERIAAFRDRRARGGMELPPFPDYRLEGAEAVRHLFRVACGLDSAVLGDVQILGQVRRAMTMSASCGTLGRYLQRAFTLALDGGALARMRTSISSGAASIGSALASVVAERSSASSGPTKPAILIIGAGEIASDVARHLSRRHLGDITFANRTERKALALAKRYRASTARWPALCAAIEEADVVVAATSSREPIVTRERLDTMVSHRRGRPLLVVDAGMPRNVEPGSSVEVIDIDAIHERRHQTRAEREAAVPEVEHIIAERLRTWEQWLSLQPLETSLKALYLMASQASQDAVEELRSLEHQDPREMEQIVLKSMKRVLHDHVRSLRDFAPALARLRPRRELERNEPREPARGLSVNE